MAANDTDAFQLEICPNDATTPTPTPSNTPTDTPLPTWSPTPTDTPLPTATSTPTPTATSPAPLACAIYDSYLVPPANLGSATITMTKGVDFRVRNADVYNSSGNYLAQGSYTWNAASGPQQWYTLAVTATMDVCIDVGAEPQPTPTWTQTPAAGGPPDSPPGAAIPTEACVEPITPSPWQQTPLPDLAAPLPTLRNMPPISATITITAGEYLTWLGTVEAAIETPAASVLSTTSDFTWSEGAARGAEFQGHMTTGLAWLAILNPLNMGYESEGTVLWSIAPVVQPMLPALLVSLILIFHRYVLWLVLAVIRGIYKFITDTIELIPGE